MEQGGSKVVENFKETFYIYDERMLKHREFPKPQPDGKLVVNPEIPDRIARIHRYLEENGFLAKMDKLEVQGLDEIESLLTKIHSQELVDLVRNSCAKLGEGEGSQCCNPAVLEIYECKDSYEAALVSASAAVTGVRDILKGDHQRGYCIVRPPGHHAYHNQASGFCFFNNAALAAKIAID